MEQTIRHRGCQRGRGRAFAIAGQYERRRLEILQSAPCPEKFRMEVIFEIVAESAAGSVFQERNGDVLRSARRHGGAQHHTVARRLGSDRAADFFESRSDLVERDRAVVLRRGSHSDDRHVRFRDGLPHVRRGADAPGGRLASQVLHRAWLHDRRTPGCHSQEPKEVPNPPPAPYGRDAQDPRSLLSRHSPSQSQKSALAHFRTARLA